MEDQRQQGPEQPGSAPDKTGGPAPDQQPTGNNDGTGLLPGGEDMASGGLRSSGPKKQGQRNEDDFESGESSPPAGLG